MKTKILVVEDETIIGMEIKDRLVGFGYDVPDVVYTGEEAVERAAIVQPDLILMDIMLDGEMDGVEAAKRIRERFDIPVIYLTASSDVQTLERVKASESYGYILKPLEEEELQTAIEGALSKHEMERQAKEYQETVLCN